MALLRWWQSACRNTGSWHTLGACASPTRILQSRCLVGWLRKRLDRRSVPPSPPLGLGADVSVTLRDSGTTFSWFDPFARMRFPDQMNVVRPWLAAEAAYAQTALTSASGAAAFVKRVAAEISSREAVDLPPAPDIRGAFAYYHVTSADGWVKLCRRHINNQGGGHGTEESYGPEHVLVDHKKLSDELGGCADVTPLKVSTDGKRAAYTVDSTGAERYTLHVIDLPAEDARAGSCARRVDEVHDVWGFQWPFSSNCILYTRQDCKFRPAELWLHEIPLVEDRSNTITSEGGCDRLLHRERDDKFFLDIGKTKDDVFLTINSHSKVSSEVAVLRAIDPTSPPVVVRPRGSGQYFVEHHDGWIYVLATAGADTAGDDGLDKSTFYLARVPASDPSAAEWEFVASPPEGCAIEDADFFDACIVLHLRNERGLREFLLLPYEGALSSKRGVAVRLPSSDEVAAVTPGSNSDPSASVFTFSTSTPLVPRVEWEISLPTGELRRVREVPCRGTPHFASSCYETRRRFYRGISDGDPEVPVTVTQRVDHASRKGGGPTLVHVYGAYGEPLEPHYDAANVCLLRRGWVVAHCHARGGGELGRSWHEAGRGGSKGHTADDLRATIAGLVNEGLADPDRIVCLGASAGGLAVAMLCVRDPHAMAGAVLRVPYLDMITSLLDADLPLTTHEWDEWGDPSADVVTLDQLRSVCPYHSLAKCSEHPHVLATASTLDKRVQFWHPAKYVARLRSSGIAMPSTSQSGVTPVSSTTEAFLLTSDDSGHFGGGGADHLALEIAFMHRATKSPLR